MKRQLQRIASVAVVVAALAPAAQAGTWVKSVDAAVKKAKADKQLIFVDLFADWCGWCHKMEKEVFPSAAFQNATDDMVLLKVDTEDGAEGTKLAQKFAVTSLPTVLILTPEQTMAGMIRGYLPAKEMSAAIVDIVGKYRDFEKRVAAEGALGTDYKKRLDLAKEFNRHWDFKKAETRFKKLIADTKAPAEIRDQAFYELALTQVMQTQLDAATQTLKSFAKVQSKGETYERSRILQGQIYVQQGNMAAAATEFRSFKAKFPKSPLVANVDSVLPQIERLLPRK